MIISNDGKYFDSTHNVTKERKRNGSRNNRTKRKGSNFEVQQKLEKPTESNSIITELGLLNKKSVNQTRWIAFGYLSISNYYYSKGLTPIW